MRKFFSIILMILGVGIFMWGSRISDQAEQGEEKISQAEENLQERRQPLVGPIRKNVSAKAAENAERKIGQAEQKITKSQVTADWLRGSGIVVFAVGLGYLILSFKKPR